MKKAFITGITGQDGSYLAELLLEKAGSVDNYPSVYEAVSSVMPDEVYHLAAQSFVSYSFEDAFSTLESNTNGVHFTLSAARQIVPDARFYFAASSEMFGKVHEVPQRESTRFHPRSPYGISKVTGFYLTMNYRESYDMFGCNGILYNHESPRRGFEFVTRKISYHVAMIKLGLTDRLDLGNLEAKRDWGHAKDYVEAMWLMLQQEAPDDYVVCSEETHSVREYCEKAFAVVDLDYRDYVRVDPKFFRPAEVDLLLGDSAKARERLGWERSVSFEGLVEEMVENDLRLMRSSGRSESSPA